MTTVYLSIPIRHRIEADQIEKYLKNQYGIEVLNPCSIVHDHLPEEDIPVETAEECRRLIEQSDAVILFTDYFGRDCAAEIGYTHALSKFGKPKPVYPFYLFDKASFLHQDWMIKPLEPISEGLDALAEKIRAKFGESDRTTNSEEPAHMF